jgi:hypothetical protein
VAPPSSQHVPDAVADHYCAPNLGVEPFGRGNEQIWVWFGVHNLWHALPVVGRACRYSFIAVDLHHLLFAGFAGALIMSFI